MIANLVLSGGPGHDFDASSAALAEVLAAEGVDSTVVTSPTDALDRLTSAAPPDLLTVNALRWRIEDGPYAADAGRWGFELDDDAARGLADFVAAGGGLLACHTAVICFDAHPRWAALVGATWSWDRSSHPPRGPARVEVTEAGRRHPITEGIDDFTTTDEVYGFLDHHGSLDALLVSSHGGASHPLLWARPFGDGRVVTSLLGHDAAAVTQPEHANALRRSARWLIERTP